MPAKKKNEYPVIISVTGISSADGEEPGEQVRMLSTGICRKTADGYELRYSENDPESGESSSVVIGMSPGTVFMTRSGPYATDMVFKKGSRYEGAYNTPYGAFNMGVYTSGAFWENDETYGKISVRYQLEMQNRFITVHDLNIVFTRNE